MNRSNLLAVLTSLATISLAGGCNTQPPPPAYGANGPSPMAMPDPSAMPSPTVVPAGARPLATGGFDQIRFTVPYETGLLYILDVETKRVVSTNSVQADGGKSETMTDLRNTTQGLSTTDHYQVYFAPTQPTTRPLGGGM